MRELVEAGGPETLARNAAANATRQEREFWLGVLERINQDDLDAWDEMFCSQYIRDLRRKLGIRQPKNCPRTDALACQAISRAESGAMTKRLDPTEYLDDPAKAVALLNEVLSGDGNDRAIKQAVTVLVITLKRAGFGDGRRACPPSERMRGRPSSYQT